MPGTIQVSVLDFMGLQSSSPASRLSIKVSMGKREYQTSDKGDFSFPLANLRDNLIIVLLDAEGNEISHTGVETRLVVEKGLWDEIFPLEGGGHVHMKLQFVLSEEDRHRIRVMRESALRKKHGELLDSNLGSPENATTVDSNIALSLHLNQEVSDSQQSLLQSKSSVATQAGPVSTPLNFLKNAQFGIEDREGTHSIQRQMTPNDTDRYGETSSTAPLSREFGVHLTKASHRGLVEKTETQTPPVNVPVRAICSEEDSSLLGSPKSVVAKNNLISRKLEEDGANNPEKQRLLEKTPSTVRNMISAFESGLPQYTRPHIKAPPAKSQSSKIGLEAALKGSHLSEVKTEKIKTTKSITGRVTNLFPAEELQQPPTLIRKSEEQLGFVGPFNGATSSQDTGQLKEVSAADIQTEGTNADLKNKFIHKEGDIKEEKICSEDRVRESAGEATTFSGRKLDDLGRQKHSNFFGKKQHCGAKIVTKARGKGIYTKDSQEMNIEVNEAEKASHKVRKSKVESSADAETSRGPVGQVMRVVIMVGFAALVLLTRQRKNR